MLPKATEQQDHKTKEEACRQIQAAIEEYDELQTLVRNGHSVFLKPERNRN